MKDLVALKMREIQHQRTLRIMKISHLIKLSKLTDGKV